MKHVFLFFICTFFTQGLLAQEGITLEDLWSNYTYYERGVPNFRFMNDGLHYSRMAQGDIIAYDITTGEPSETLFSPGNYIGKSGFEGGVSGYKFSADERFILLTTESESIYRHSSKAHYFIFNRSNGALTKVFDGEKQMYATLSPDGTKVAFLVNNDIYYRTLPDGDVVRVTENGKINEIINGGADWVYEEEFSMSRAFEWSPDSKHIAFLRFDERQVPEYTMMNYVDGLYPEYTTFKYPKVGEKNAIVSTKIYSLEKKKTTTVELPNEELYVPRIKWSDADYLIVTTLNRHQNHLRLWNVKAKNGKSTVLLDEKNKYYINLHDHLQFLSNGKEFIWMSEKNGYNQVFLYDMKGKEKRCLTPGEYDVTRLYGVDEERGQIYYQAADASPLTRNVFRVGLDGKQREQLNETEGWNGAQFSKTYDYYVASHSTANTPPTFRVMNRAGKLVRDLELNESVRQQQEQANVSPVEFFTFKTMDDVSLNGYMIKPKDFDKKKKYPVFMYLYGGPNSQQAVNSWRGQNYWWFQLLASKGYIVACVDNRGTGARGEEFRKTTYMKLGYYETIDQIEAAKYLGDLPYVDKKRIGIFGWSYGGYMSSLCLLKGNDVFSMAIAVAPVTNWRWYDTIYTERYMRTEKENPDGYKENSPVYFADRLRGKYLLIHGGADDNVHVQNAMEMSGALIQANKQFDFYYYPNNNHGIYNGNARLHLYQKMTDFIEENL